MMEYKHVDVFSHKPFSGNGLDVFICDQEISSDRMQEITIEMRQFESIFLQSTEQADTFRARIYTEQEELDFAGHPVLGAASVLHEKFKQSEIDAKWTLILNTKNVQVTSKRSHSWYETVMEQGVPIFDVPLSCEQSLLFFDSLNLSPEDGIEELPLQVVSTGLPYLIVPIKSNIEKARIMRSDFEKLLEAINAKFVYVFDVHNNEGRTWDNEGCVEDIATGSAAGPMAAYLVQYQKAALKDTIIINQGRFMGRPSKIEIKVDGSRDKITSIQVGGAVCMVARGTLDSF